MTCLHFTIPAKRATCCLTSFSKRRHNICNCILYMYSVADLFNKLRLGSYMGFGSGLGIWLKIGQYMG